VKTTAIFISADEDESLHLMLSLYLKNVEMSTVPVAELPAANEVIESPD
jgi:hypothetical protein